MVDQKHPIHSAEISPAAQRLFSLFTRISDERREENSGGIEASVLWQPHAIASFLGMRPQQVEQAGEELIQEGLVERLPPGSFVGLYFACGESGDPNRFPFLVYTPKDDETLCRASESGRRTRGINTPEPQPGVVYVLEAGGRYKIGRTKNLEARLRQLRSGTPFPIAVVKVIDAPDTAGPEHVLHAMFSHCRMHNEWFALDKNDLAYLCSLRE